MFSEVNGGGSLNEDPVAALTMALRRNQTLRLSSSVTSSLPTHPAPDSRHPSLTSKSGDDQSRSAFSEIKFSQVVNLPRRTQEVDEAARALRSFSETIRAWTLESAQSSTSPTTIKHTRRHKAQLLEAAAVLFRALQRNQAKLREMGSDHYNAQEQEERVRLEAKRRHLEQGLKRLKRILMRGEKVDKSDDPRSIPSNQRIKRLPPKPPQLITSSHTSELIEMPFGAKHEVGTLTTTADGLLLPDDVLVAEVQSMRRLYDELYDELRELLSGSNLPNHQTPRPQLDLYEHKSLVSSTQSITAPLWATNLQASPSPLPSLAALASTASPPDKEVVSRVRPSVSSAGVPATGLSLRPSPMPSQPKPAGDRDADSSSAPAGDANSFADHVLHMQSSPLRLTMGRTLQYRDEEQLTPTFQRHTNTHSHTFQRHTNTHSDTFQRHTNTHSDTQSHTEFPSIVSHPQQRAPTPADYERHGDGKRHGGFLITGEARNYLAYRSPSNNHCPPPSPSLLQHTSYRPMSLPDHRTTSPSPSSPSPSSPSPSSYLSSSPSVGNHTFSPAFSRTRIDRRVGMSLSHDGRHDGVSPSPSPPSPSPPSPSPPSRTYGGPGLESPNLRQSVPMERSASSQAGGSQRLAGETETETCDGSPALSVDHSTSPTFADLISPTAVNYKHASANSNSMSPDYRGTRQPSETHQGISFSHLHTNLQPPETTSGLPASPSPEHRHAVSPSPGHRHAVSPSPGHRHAVSPSPEHRGAVSSYPDWRTDMAGSPQAPDRLLGSPSSEADRVRESPSSPGMNGLRASPSPGHRHAVSPSPEHRHAVSPSPAGNQFHAGEIDPNTDSWGGSQPVMYGSMSPEQRTSLSGSLRGSTASPSRSQRVSPSPSPSPSQSQRGSGISVESSRRWNGNGSQFSLPLSGSLTRTSLAVMPTRQSLSPAVRETETYRPSHSLRSAPAASISFLAAPFRPAWAPAQHPDLATFKAEMLKPSPLGSANSQTRPMVPASPSPELSSFSQHSASLASRAQIGRDLRGRPEEAEGFMPQSAAGLAEFKASLPAMNDPQADDLSSEERIINAIANSAPSPF